MTLIQSTGRFFAGANFADNGLMDVDPNCYLLTNIGWENLLLETFG